jgi:RNA polymerase sigma-70 factor (ECF subfamily)
VLAVLAGRLGDVERAEDAVQEALLEAARSWPERGVPENPAGWLMTVAHRKAIDRIRLPAGRCGSSGIGRTC